MGDVKNGRRIVSNFHDNASCGTRQRPIIFKPSMVRAILDKRKTQTRRIVRHGLPCRFAVDDELWVREEWRAPVKFDCMSPAQFIVERSEICYCADNPRFPSVGRWRSSIHMPKWASRIRLRVVGVRQEPLNNISDEDAKREGAERRRGEWVWQDDCPSFLNGFAHQWILIHGERSWNKNPLVWVVEFAPIWGIQEAKNER
jgi:hypothetical protein